MSRKLPLGFSLSVALWLLLFFPATVIQAATLSVGPNTGSFSIDSTFEVSLLLNTEGEAVNAVDVTVSFPPDKLQLVSPAATNSIIQLWTAPPQFNNQSGRVELQGGVPGGINVSNGLVIKLTFRAKTVGTALVKFLDNSRVLRHDGLGTDVLRSTSNAIYQLVLPPPAGPDVVSSTHPDQTQWYATPNAVFEWAKDTDVEAHSYLLDSIPTTVPDDIAEGLKTSVGYKNLADGVYYFHVKALRNGVWGGVTHYAINLDTTPPASFPIEVLPSNRTDRRQPLIQFTTTDERSGLDHYEIKIVPLQLSGTVDAGGSQPFFIEAQSPYIPPPLKVGTYDIIVRAHDKAKNHREVIQHLAITTALFRFIRGEGLEIRQTVVIPWSWLWATGGLLFSVLTYIGWRLHRWHHEVHHQQHHKVLPESLTKQLGDLKRYRAKYRGPLLLAAMLIGGWLMGAHVLAQEVTFAPPLVTTIPRAISNQEIFYLGGKTQTPNTEVILYLQNLQTGETTSQRVTSDEQGDWFYRHGSFLTSGNYQLWVQGKVGEQISPPSAQLLMTVQPTALQFGASRVSYETLYLGLSVLLLVALLGATGYLVFHGYHGRRKHRQLLKEVREAEESVRRGFAVLRRDIEAELNLLHRAKPGGQFSSNELQQEAQLRKDLAWVEQYIGKEIWDIEILERQD